MMNNGATRTKAANQLTASARQLRKLAASLGRYAPRVLLGGLLLVAFSLPARADAPTREYFQLLNELKEEIEHLSFSGDHPACVDQGLRLTREVIDDGLRSDLLDRVVVQSLEKGAKTALALLPQGAVAQGAAQVGVSTYDLIGCAMDADGPRTYGDCVWKIILEAFETHRKGKVKEKLGIENPASVVAFDESYAAAKGAISTYQQGQEYWNYMGEEGDCDAQVGARWNKNARGRSGGTITLTAKCDCACPNRFSVRDSSILVISVPVQYAPADGRKPGWRLGRIRKTRTDVSCCGGGRGVVTLDGAGNKIAPRPPVTTQPEGEPSEPGEPKQPEEPDEPEDYESVPKPERKVFTVENPCPACQPLKDQLDQLTQRLEELQSRREELTEQREQTRDELDALQERGDTVRDTIEYLQSRLEGKAGVGGESYDPATDLTTKSYVQEDGKVHTVVKDSDGNVVEESTREYEPLERVRNKLERKRRELKQIEADIARAKQKLKETDRKLDTISFQLTKVQDEREDVARKLEVCVRRKCARQARCDQLEEWLDRYYETVAHPDPAQIENIRQQLRALRCLDDEKARTPPVEVELEQVVPIRGFNPFSPADVRSLRQAGNAPVAPTPTPTEPPPAEPPPTEPPPTATPTPTPAPTISVAPTQTVFTHNIGSSPCPQPIDTVQISNTGGGTLRWSARVTLGSTWLTLSRATGVGASSLDLAFNCAQTGPLSGQVTITGEDADTGESATNEVVVTVEGSAR